ncbi:hypothetical protein CONLIGDRAFT_411970 [Coniochaeta ligniaria NRRL 30616]|uniref:Uncharacterized protein n=1 Tax=Coniochaeta ligniaria NRRL 30616 TaxID=1408157 RepID=A0A1J7INR7_9PEZI|nr:hypothetical protein CONLIGDRAFT_411970 [Coniochaeta ligniaria NRRL 30616]
MRQGPTLNQGLAYRPVPGSLSHTHLTTAGPINWAESSAAEGTRNTDGGRPGVFLSSGMADPCRWPLPLHSCNAPEAPKLVTDWTTERHVAQSWPCGGSLLTRSLDEWASRYDCSRLPAAEMNARYSLLCPELGRRRPVIEVDLTFSLLPLDLGLPLFPCVHCSSGRRPSRDSDLDSLCAPAVEGPRNRQPGEHIAALLPDSFEYPGPVVSTSFWSLSLVNLHLSLLPLPFL